MLQDERTLIVIADGGHARLVEERRRGGVLHERDDWSAGLAPSGHVGGGSPGRVFDRFGEASHPVGGADPRDKAEDHFLAQVAARVAELGARHVFDGVILIAPPRALGRLRSALPVTLKPRVRHTEDKDRVKIGLDELRELLVDIRRRGA